MALKVVPLYIRAISLVKSFNPSADPSVLLILSRKQAEGFGIQTLQEGSALADILQRPRFYQTLLIRDLQVQASA